MKMKMSAVALALLAPGLARATDPCVAPFVAPLAYHQAAPIVLLPIAAYTPPAEIRIVEVQKAQVQKAQVQKKKDVQRQRSRQRSIQSY